MRILSSQSGRRAPAAALVLLMVLAGCHHADIRFDAVNRLDESGWELPSSAGAQGHALFVNETKGLFPSALAVARIEPAHGDAAAADSAEAPHRWSIWPLKEVDAIYWNGLMTDVPQVREVLVLQKRATPRDEIGPRELGAAAARRQAGLYFLYGVTSDDPLCYRMGGLLVRASTGEKIAAISAQAGPEDFQLPPEGRYKTDLRHQDPSYLCARKLEANVRACLLDLIGQDKAAATQPSPWQDGRPQVPPPEIIIVPRS